VGQHTRGVLRDLLGYKDERIAELIAAGIVEGPA
jgi:crotonobetainyl-CoA:carnitine CoA-transferase CaiB-like acyl-CoA transferase